MKKSELIKIIKEEISNTLKEAPLFQPTENPLSPGRLSLGSIQKPSPSSSNPEKAQLSQIEKRFPGAFLVLTGPGQRQMMTLQDLKRAYKPTNIILDPPPLFHENYQKKLGYKPKSLSLALGGALVKFRLDIITNWYRETKRKNPNSNLPSWSYRIPGSIYELTEHYLKAKNAALVISYTERHLKK